MKVSGCEFGGSGIPYGAGMVNLMVYGMVIQYMAHKPPSRLRYEKENPIVSFRLTRTLRERVDKIKEGATYPQTVRLIIQRFLDTTDAP